MKPERYDSNPRYQAYMVLKRVMIDGQSLTQGLSLFPDMSGFAKAICFGTLRDYIRLSVIVNHLVTKKPKKKSLEILLMMGIFQLQSTEKPDYAVVTETVSISRADKLGWASGMVNGVLRRFCREKDKIVYQCQQEEIYQNNHPVWLVDMLSKAWPKQINELLVENDRQAPMSLRVNLAKVTRQAYYNKLKKHGIEGSLSQEIPSAITLSTPVDVDQLSGFYQGLVSVQDEAAQLAAFLLQLEPGLRVLDACAAPGGKTCHLLESESNLSEVVALDLSELRLAKVRQNLERLDLSANLVCSDAAKIDEWWDGAPFDRILLDAPCSATGVIRRHPDIKYHRKQNDIPSLVSTQQQLLNSLWSILKPGGVLVYATCSVLPEENEGQIETFCRNHDEVILEPIAIGLPSAGKLGLQLFPTSSGHDGFYYAVLRKVP